MPISNKTRKIIWARSGNICSICKAKLVSDKAEPYPSTIFGEECHIISQRPNGPRHISIDNYDDEDNLIILCANCHKSIDNNLEYYTVEKIKKLKDIHQTEIREKLIKTDLKNIFSKVNDVTILPKVSTGKTLLNLLDEPYGFYIDYEDTTVKEDIEFIARIIETLTDYSDLFQMNDEIGYKISKINNLQNILNEIDASGFVLFGEKTVRDIVINNIKHNNWMVSSIYLMKKENPNIVRY